MSAYLDLKGTTEASFNIGLGSSAVKLKNNSGVLDIRNKADSAFLDIKCKELKSSADVITLNDDAAGAGADWKMIFARPASGMTAAVTYTFPAVPTAGYILQTDGSGNLSWVAAPAAPSVTEKVTCDSTPFVFGDIGADIAMFVLPANAVVHDVQVIVDVALDAGTLSVGITGTVDKYMTTAQNDLAEASRFQSSPNHIPSGSTETIKATTTGAPTVGSGRILVFYSIPA